LKLSHRASVAAAAERVWAVVMNVPTAAKCMPGVAAVDPLGPDRFKGSLLVQIGPVRLVLDGEVVIVSRDDAARKASLKAEAKDTRLGGTVRATIDVALSEGPSGCEMRIDGDVQIAGRIGEFGQPVIQRKSEQLLAQFAQCLGRTAAA